MSSVNKTSNSKFTIIRKPDYARKTYDSIEEIDISNKDTKLDNKTFGDLIFNNKQQNKKDKPAEDKKVTRLHDEQKKDGDTKNDKGITDFYI